MAALIGCDVEGKRMQTDGDEGRNFIYSVTQCESEILYL